MKRPTISAIGVKHILTMARTRPSCCALLVKMCFTPIAEIVVKRLRIFLTIFFLLCTTSVLAETTFYNASVNTSTDPKAPPDALITSNINNAITGNPVLSYFNIKVSTQNGIVSLSGTVDTLDQAKLLVHNVALFEGVKDVFTNDISVKENSPTLADDLITEKVRSALIREKIFKNVEDVSKIPIDIQTNNGIVYLRGVVDSQDQMTQVIQLIQRMRSVPRVISLLQIRTGTTSLP
ncbi:MAG: BON domain-containing protein [Gammaproteobacteria bacterium]|nr:BON domain-containing protein [Gammaproteobacteria bacterium]